jgi:hypothetical protein
MATVSPATAARNARLDALQTATNEWCDRRTKELQDRVTTIKKVLKGRTGSERLASTTTQAASGLVVQMIDDFLLAT